MKEIDESKGLVAGKVFGLSEEDVGALVTACAYGRSYRDVGAEYGLTVAQVKSIIDRAAVSWFDGENLRREMHLEVQRLSALGRKYFIEALKGDQNASLLYLRISERKSILQGMTPVQGHAITIINQAAAPERQTTTEEIGSIIDHIRSQTQH